MTPVNNKSLMAFMFNQMEQLNDKKIDVPEANAQANLLNKVTNLMKYELDRAKVQMKLTEHNAIYKDGLTLRNIESKPFDNETK